MPFLFVEDAVIGESALLWDVLTPSVVLSGLVFVSLGVPLRVYILVFSGYLSTANVDPIALTKVFMRHNKFWVL